MLMLADSALLVFKALVRNCFQPRVPAAWPPASFEGPKSFLSTTTEDVQVTRNLLYT